MLQLIWRLVLFFPNTAKYIHSLGPCHLLRNLFSLYKLLAAAAWPGLWTSLLSAQHPHFPPVVSATASWGDAAPASNIPKVANSLGAQITFCFLQTSQL